MKLLSRTFTLLAGAVAALVLLPMSQVFAADPLKIGYIYPSPAGDVGWAYELDRGRLAIEEAFGDKVESMVVENIPEGPDAARIMNQFAAQGAKMIMLGSFGYMNDGLKLAKRYPDIKIIHASGYSSLTIWVTFKLATTKAPTLLVSQPDTLLKLTLSEWLQLMQFQKWWVSLTHSHWVHKR